MVSNFFLAPIVSTLFFSGKIEELRWQFIRITQSVALACLPLAAILIFMPKFVLGYFGKGYPHGSVYLMVMALTQLFNVATGSVNTILNMAGYEKDLIRSIAIAFFVEVVCLAVLGPVYGGLGFAIAYAANIVTQNALAAIFVHQRVGINILSMFDVRKSAVSS